MEKSKARVWTLSLALAAVLGMAGFALAGGPPAGPCGGPAYSELGPEKQAELEKLHKDFYSNTETNRQLLISKRHELDAQLYNPSPDDKKIQALTKEISELKGKLFEARVGLKQQMHKLGVYKRGGERGYGHWGGDRGPCGPCGGEGGRAAYRGKGHGAGHW